MSVTAHEVITQANKSIQLNCYCQVCTCHCSAEDNDSFCSLIYIVYV